MIALQQLPGRKAWSIAEAAMLSGLSRDVLYKEIQRGRLVARKAGRRTIIVQKDLERYLPNLPKARSQAA
jgi:excisionase family DNA binding protein